VPIIFQQGTTSQRSQTLVVGTGLTLSQTTDGLSQISAGSGASSGGEVVLQPSGADDTAAIRSAIGANARVRLAPGSFNVSGIVDLASGVLVSGSGLDKTTIVKSNYNGPVFRFGDQVQYAGIENLHIVGPGQSIANGNKGIQAARSAPPTGLAVARRLTFRNLRIEDLGENALYFDTCSEVEISNIIIARTGLEPIYFSGGGALSMRAVRAESCNSPFYFRFAAGLEISACEAESCFTSFKFNTVTDAALIGCTSKKCTNVPLKISAGSNIVVAGFSSDNTGAPYFVNQPHLLVDTGALGVEILGFRRVNTDQAGVLTSEASVTGAGGQVLVGYHNFDTTKIVSGGKFAQVTTTVLP
jgi:hypothetical protein